MKLSDKKGMSGALLSLIILALLVLILTPTILKAGIIGADTFKCESPSKNGECLPEGTSDRIPIGGVFTDCEKKSKDTGQSLACFFKKENEGGGMVGVAEHPVETGANLRMATYAGSHEFRVPSPSSSPMSGTVVENVKLTGASSLRLYAGRLYAFYGLISGKDYTYCSLYFRKGGYKDNNIFGTPSVGKCDDPMTWSAPLYYVPQDSDNTLHLQLVMLMKKSLDDHYPAEGSQNDRLLIISNIEIVAKPVLTLHSFSGNPGTDVSALTDGDIPDIRPKSFTLENEKVGVEFRNTVVHPDANLNFDQIIGTGVDEITLDGTKLTGYSGGVLKLTIKNARWKMPPTPLLGYFSYERQADPSYKEAFKSCDICSAVSFSQTGDASFLVEVSAVRDKFLRFRVFPGTCGILSKAECLAVPLQVEGLECYWADTQCVRCDPAKVGECGDYGDERAFCIADSCNVDDDPNFDSSCTYVDRRWWFNACVSCKDKDACEEYDGIRDACVADPCSVNRQCTWSPVEEKCVDCKAISSCGEYDDISRDEQFCEENVCGIGEGCLRAGGSCIARQGSASA